MAEKDTQLFHVAADLAGQTIVTVMRKWLAGKSWNDARRLLASRRIMVNGNLCLDAGRRLKEGEVLKLLANPAATPPREEDVRVRFMDTHLVVIEKPAGMTTLRHPEERNWPRRRKQLQPTLDEILPRIIEKKAQGRRQGKASGPKPAGRNPSRQKGPPRRLRAVHRIDRETSGLMVFARTIEAESKLGLQFRAHSLDRVYLAIVSGDVKAQTIESRLVPDRGDGRRGSTRDPQLGKAAVTHVRPIDRTAGYTLLECRLETGRTHQIRIHLSESGHPLCGDKVYRGPFPGKPLVDDSGAPRVALHAAELGFEHPVTGEKLRFSMPLPADLSDLWNRLRQQSRAAKKTTRQ